MLLTIFIKAQSIVEKDMSSRTIKALELSKHKKTISTIGLAIFKYENSLKKKFKKNIFILFGLRHKTNRLLTLKHNIVII